MVNTSGTTNDGQVESSVAAEVGRQLRRVRRRRRMTLAVVAAAADTSESFLSQLERGQTGASLATLARLAHALGIRVADLFEPDPVRESEVLSASERPVLHVWHLGVKTLLTPRSCEHLEVLGCHLDPGGTTGEEPYTHDDSDELFLVLEGYVQLELRDRVYEMRQGDCITYRSSTPHRVINHSDEAAEALWIIGPPSF